ncbi:MAG TPA: glycosyltransferase family protein [Crinalium sp.]|jgi:spore coat polysaccharide biosynthesis protein SpsF
MKTAAIIQARMGSTRLPGKVLKRLCDKTVLAHVISRVQNCPLVDEVIVATTTSEEDNAIVLEAEKYKAKWFRGSEHDVLERYYLAAKEYGIEVIIRITSDCPLFDPAILFDLLSYFQDETTQGLRIDYLSNTLNRTYPIGLDAEVFTFEALEEAFLRASQPYEREHVTPYIYQHPLIFSLHNQSNDEDLSSYRWTLDTKEDFQFIQVIYEALYRHNCLFTTDEILDFLTENPELIKINSHIKQKQLGE